MPLVNMWEDEGWASFDPCASLKFEFDEMTCLGGMKNELNAKWETCKRQCKSFKCFVGWTSPFGGRFQIWGIFPLRCLFLNENRELLNQINDLIVQAAKSRGFKWLGLN